jgi:hypothetical protein
MVDDGGVVFWNNGLLRWLTDPGGPVVVPRLAFSASVYLIYFAFFGFLVQFVFRWLTLCRNCTVSSKHYFAMLAAVQLIPLVNIAVSAILFFPPPDHRTLHDQAVATADFGLNASQMVVSIFVPFNVEFRAFF